MVAIGPHPVSGHSPRGMSQPSQRWAPAATNTVDAPKAYHATGEWGKRGMTFQELTRAFDAFNEAEEKVAIGFAWSEDCARRLEEPLSEVKTTFCDLDGLRPIFPLDEPSSTPSSSATATPISSHRPISLRPPSNFKHSDDFGHVRPSEIDALCIGGSTSGTVRRASVCCFKADEDTIKASQKRRRSLSAISPPVSPSAPDNDVFMHEIRPGEHVEDPPERPPARLGFYDRDAEENDADSLRICGVQDLERITPGGTG